MTSYEKKKEKEKCMSGEMSPQCGDMKGLFSPVTLSEHLQRRTGEHETSGAPIQSL